MPRKLNHVFNQICDINNINAADETARQGKIRSSYYIFKHDVNRDLENKSLSVMLHDGLYKTSQYTCFKIFEPKERIIYKLPYYPDRICHHALLNVIKPYWEHLMIDQTYSCIKGRGIHKCLNDVKKCLCDKRNTRYCLELDIRKFYPSINHNKLKEVLHSKIKDIRLLDLLDELIDSVKNIPGYEEKGIPIGNWTSQYFGNLFLTPLDKYCKGILKCKYYFRYADDIRIFSNNKKYLWNCFDKIKNFLINYKLELKSNCRIVDIKKNGTDFLGYVIYHNHVRLRKRIKLHLFKSIKRLQNNKISYYEFMNSYNSYRGWLKFCNSKHLLQKIHDLTGIPTKSFNGESINKYQLKNKTVHIVDIELRHSYFNIFLIKDNKPYIYKCKNKQLFYKFINKYNYNAFKNKH